jgi:hypothetical protein
MATLAESREPHAGAPSRGAGETGPRRRALAGAALATAAALAAAYGVWRAVGQPTVPQPKAVQETIEVRGAR